MTGDIQNLLVAYLTSFFAFVDVCKRAYLSIREREREGEKGTLNGLFEITDSDGIAVCKRGGGGVENLSQGSRLRKTP